MSQLPLRSLRLQRRSASTLDTLNGSSGEIFYDSDNRALRLYTGAGPEDRVIFASRTWVIDNTFSGNYVDLTNKPFIPTDTSDLTNEAGFVTQIDIDEAVGGVDLSGYATLTYVDDAVSNIDLSTYATLEYVDDLVETITAPDLSGYATLTYVDDAIAAIPPTDLTGYATETYVGTQITNLVDSSPETLNTLNELAAALGDDPNFATTVATNIGTKEPIITAGTVAQYWRGDKSWQTLNASAVGLGNVTNESKATMFTSPTFTGTVSGITKAMVGLGNVTNIAQEPAITAGTTGQYWRGDKSWQTLNASAVGLGNVTNESKATMFTSPTFTGTVSGVTATHVGLGNVTNESKATMFTSPTFTGTVSGVTATMVGLGNVTNESKATMFTSPTFTGTVSGVTATMVGLGNVTNESKATMFTSPTFTGITTLQQSTEVLNTKTAATGVVVHDFSTGAIWVHSSISANFTANFTNVPTTNDRAINIVLALVQGATPYIPNAVQIGGAAQTINWQGGSAPSGNANKRDLVSFTLIRTGSTWTVLGSLTTYG